MNYIFCKRLKHYIKFYTFIIIIFTPSLSLIGTRIYCSFTVILQYLTIRVILNQLNKLILSYCIVQIIICILIYLIETNSSDVQSYFTLNHLLL